MANFGNFLNDLRSKYENKEFYVSRIIANLLINECVLLVLKRKNIFRDGKNVIMKQSIVPLMRQNT